MVQSLDSSVLTRVLEALRQPAGAVDVAGGQGGGRRWAVGGPARTVTRRVRALPAAEAAARRAPREKRPISWPKSSQFFCGLKKIHAPAARIIINIEHSGSSHPRKTTVLSRAFPVALKTFLV